MQILVNGKPVVLSGETIIPCPTRCGGNKWASFDSGKMYCPKCEREKAAHLLARFAAVVADAHADGSFIRLEHGSGREQNTLAVLLELVRQARGEGK